MSDDDMIRRGDVLDRIGRGGLYTIQERLVAIRALPAVQPDAAQCCMCGKRGLLTADDGGPQCELHDGRWVCSAGCYDVALGIMLKPVAGAAQKGDSHE
jgi:hypothetical protein